MKCPFIIPVEKIDDYQDRRGKKYYRIIDVAKCTIVEGISEELADFLVIAINSHEKLAKDLKKYGKHKLSCNYAQNLKGGVIEQCDCGFEQAIGEKPK